MEFSEARSIIRMHAGAEDGPRMATGLVASLRPYAGLDDGTFEEVMRAVAAVADRLGAGLDVDRGLIHALWSMCRTARLWGVDESGMLVRNRLISPDDRRKLEAWVDVIESTTLDLLWGIGLPLAIRRYAEAVAQARLPAPGASSASLFVLALRCDDADVRIDAAGALGRMGGAARDAAPALQRCAKDADPEVGRAASLALESIARATGEASTP